MHYFITKLATEHFCVLKTIGIQEKPTNCGTKAADELGNFFSRETLMRIH